MPIRRWRCCDRTARSPYLNGHIHQVLQKVEGNVALHTAMSLAYPLPTPGQDGIGEPGRSKFRPANWASCSARARLTVVRGKHDARDSSTRRYRSLLNLETSNEISSDFFYCCSAATTANAHATPLTVDIEKFAFAPKEITVAPGTKIVWINHDEMPHTISTTDKSFISKAMDTDDNFEQTFANAGDFSYFCTLHPFMTGIVHVRAAPGAATASTK